MSQITTLISHKTLSQKTKISVILIKAVNSEIFIRLNSNLFPSKYCLIKICELKATNCAFLINLSYLVHSASQCYHPAGVGFRLYRGQTRKSGEVVKSVRNLPGWSSESSTNSSCIRPSESSYS